MPALPAFPTHSHIVTWNLFWFLGYFQKVGGGVCSYSPAPQEAFAELKVTFQGQEPDRMFTWISGCCRQSGIVGDRMPKDAH